MGGPVTPSDGALDWDLRMVPISTLDPPEAAGALGTWDTVSATTLDLGIQRGLDRVILLPVEWAGTLVVFGWPLGWSRRSEAACSHTSASVRLHSVRLLSSRLPLGLSMGLSSKAERHFLCGDQGPQGSVLRGRANTYDS